MRMIMVRSTSNPRSVDSQTERGTFKSTCALTCLKSLSISCSHRVKEPPFVSELERVRRVVPRSPLALSFCDCGVLSPSVEPSENWSVGSGSCIGSPGVDAGLPVCSASAPLASLAVLLASASSPGFSSSGRFGIPPRTRRIVFCVAPGSSVSESPKSAPSSSVSYTPGLLLSFSASLSASSSKSRGGVVPRELQSMPRSECPAWASPVSRSFALCIAAISGKK